MGTSMNLQLCEDRMPSSSEVIPVKEPLWRFKMVLLHPELTFQANRKSEKWRNVLFQSTVTKPVNHESLMPMFGYEFWLYVAYISEYIYSIYLLFYSLRQSKIVTGKHPHLKWNQSAGDSSQIPSFGASAFAHACPSLFLSLLWGH